MNKKDLFFYVLILIVIGLFIYLIWFIKTESYACLNSPLRWGVKHLTSSNGQPITCSCSFLGSTDSLIITKDSIKKFTLEDYYVNYSFESSNKSS